MAKIVIGMVSKNKVAKLFYIVVSRPNFKDGLFLKLTSNN